MAATISPVWSRTPAATQWTSSLDSASSNDSARCVDLGQLALEAGPRGDAVRGHRGERGVTRVQRVERLGAEGRQQHLSHARAVGGQMAPDGRHHPNGVGAVHAGDVDDVRALEHGDVHGLVARGGHLRGHALRLAGEVELVGEDAPELEQPHAELVAQRLPGNDDQVAPVDQGARAARAPWCGGARAGSRSRPPRAPERRGRARGCPAPGSPRGRRGPCLALLSVCSGFQTDCRSVGGRRQTAPGAMVVTDSGCAAYPPIFDSPSSPH